MTTSDHMHPGPASEHTCAHNRSVEAALPLSDSQDFADAKRGFVATLPDVTLAAADGRVVWSLADYAFLSAQQAPPSVNPSLWRQARLNMTNGLFQVCDRIYQIRGFDISNMTIIESASGIIVIDPLISVETARAGLELYFAHRGARKVRAVIYTHSHTDHYGGVRGVVDEADVRAGHVVVIAPDRFLEEVTKENVIAGSPMVRRSQYQFGPLLPKGPLGQVDAGLGKVTSRGTVTLIAPTMEIRQPIEIHTIDGVEIVFQLTPDTEAPAEMHMFYPGLKALNLAENATHNLHNIYPIRGAQVRDANAWAKYLNEALRNFAPRSEVVFAQHHWPVWGAGRLADYLVKQRDAYKFLHDQTVRLMNHGLKPAEIAERMTWPRSLESNFATRGYYGTLSHNAKAIYQRYIGWYDANPANLAPLPPVPRSKKLVEYMGGPEPALAKAEADYAKGEYRWVADVASTIVFADPGNARARKLAADALEQLGYQAESATWRNAYLMGAQELRNGTPATGNRVFVSADMVAALTVPMLMDYLAVRIDPARADGQHIVIGLRIRDDGSDHTVNLQNCAVTALQCAPDGGAQATLTLAKAALAGLITRRLKLEDGLSDGRIALTGDRAAVEQLLGMMDEFPAMFPIIEPNPRA